MHPQELIPITETDVWECWQETSLYRYSFSLEFQLSPLQIQISGSKHVNSEILLATTPFLCYSTELGPLNESEKEFVANGSKVLAPYQPSKSTTFGLTSGLCSIQHTSTYSAG